ncbi:hypothetical protein M8J77_007560 [Diaphorina citri]|nr:hypothetical protein M8J77_007560 [Diaphorina citri]
MLPTNLPFVFLIFFGFLRPSTSDQAELDRLKAAYEARVAAEPTESIIYSWEFNKSADIAATMKTFFDPADYTYEELDQFTNVPKSFEPKVSEPHNRHQLWRIFNWYDKDKNKPEDNPYAKKYNKVVDRIKWFYKNLILRVEADKELKVHGDTRYDKICNRSNFIRHQLGKVDRLKQRLLWYGTPRTTSAKSVLHRYLLQQTLPGDAGKYTESVSPWFKIHPPYTIPDGRIMFFTWFDGSPEERIPYANPEWEHFNMRNVLDSQPVNLTARAMDPLSWEERKKLGGYTNKYLWPPRTTPTFFWRPSRRTTWDVVEGSEYIYIYDEIKKRKTTSDRGLDSSLQDRMDSAAWEQFQEDDKRNNRKMFEEERRKLLRDNNLTDSDSREKRILTALRAEMDPSRIIPGKHASADREIQDWVRDFVGAFGATKKIWFNQDLTPKRRFVGNSSRRTVNVFDEMYPTNIRESEIEFSIPTTTTLTTFLSLETLYDGLDTSEGDDSRTPPTGDEAKTKTDHQAVPKAANAREKGKAGAKAKLESLVNTQSRVKARGRPKKADVKAEAKVGQKKRKASETVMKKMSKRAKRSVGDTDKLPVDRMKRDAPQAEPEDVMADEDVPFTNSQGQCSADLKTEEVIKSRMDSDDKKVYDQIMTNVKNFKERRRNNSLSQAPVRALDRPVERTTKEKRKPTYRYTSRDVEEAERKWKEVQKMKRKKMEKHNKKRKSRSVDDPYDPVINKSAFDAFQDALYNGKTIHTLDNSTPPYEFFQQKVYPSHTINSEQLNDESFCRKILPKLEEDNKMMVSELKRRATEHYEQQKKEKHQDLSEVNEDDSFEQHLAPAEPSNTKEEAVTNRRKKREEKSDSLDESDLRRCEKINAQLKAEGYDREKIMRELNVTKNEHGELVAGRRKKRSLVRDNSVRRRRRDVRLVNKPKRVKRKTGKDSDGEYVEDMSRYKEGKRIHNQLQHDLRQYKGQEGESGPVENVIRHYENNKKIYDQPDYRKKRDLNDQPYNVKAPRRTKREEKSDSLDESDLRRCEKINAHLKAEGYDREKIMRELNVTKNEHGELVAGRRKKRSLVSDNSVRNLERQIRDKVRAQFPKREGPPSGNKSVSLDQLKRNLEIYDLIEEWKEQQVKLAMVTSKERRMLNEIDRLRDELGIPHGKDDPYYQAAVKEAIRRENEHAKLYAKEIDEWWEKEEKERRAAEAIAIANYFNTNQTGNEDFDKEKERLEEEQLDIIQKKHEKEMAERVAKGLPPDDYDELLPLAKKEMEEEQKKYEEHCKNCPKTVDELMKDFEGDADVSQLKRNLEVYDLIEKWKKRQAKKEKQQQNKQKKRRRRDVRLVNKPKRVKRKTGKDSDGEYVEDMSRYKEGKRIHNELQHDLRQYKGQEGESGPVENVIRHYENNKKIYDQPDYRKKRDLNNQPYNVKAPRRAKREEKSDSLDESDLRRCEEINAHLKAEGYDREEIMRELNVTKNEHGELVAGRRKKRSLVSDDSVRRRRRDVRLVNKPKRVKRKTGKDSDGEYVEDMSRYKEGKRIHNELQHDLRQYKGQEGESGPVENVIRHYENNKKIYDQPDYRKKRDLNNQPYNVKAPRRAKREEKSDSLDESDLRRCEKINAQLKAEGYDREKIMRELNVTKNEHGELVAGRRKKRSLVSDNSVRNLERQIRDKVRAQFPKREGPPSGNKSVSLDQLKRNLEIYDLIEEWKEQQVKLAMVTSKERRMLNEIDRLRDELGIPHGKDDPYYQAAVKEAIRRENEHAKLYAKEIDEWWEKEEKERRAAEAIAIANYFNTNQTGNEDFDKEKERLEEEQLDIIQKKHEKEMAERVAKGLPPDDYDELLPLAKKEMEEEQKKYEEHCKNCPKTVDELMKDFEGDADVSQLKRNLEVYDLIEKWKKRQAKKEKQQQNKQKRKRRDVLIARSKDALNMLKMRLENIMSRQVKPKPAQVDQPDFQVEDDYEFKRYKNTTVYEFVYDTTEEEGQQTNQTHKLQPVAKGLWPEPFISDSDGKWDQIAKEKLNSEESSMTEEVEEEAKGKAKPIRSKKAHNVLAQARYRMKETLLRRKARSVNETDMHHEGFNKELNRMIDEHIEKRKVSPYTPKIRPTAASEYPTKDDFQPFMRFSSAEMKEHQKQEQAKERFALFKAMDVIYGPTTVDDSDSYDSKEYARELATTKSTTPTKSASERSYDKIQKLRSFMRKTLDETGRKISEVMIRLNVTKGPGDSEEMRRAGIPEEWYSLQAAKATGQSIQTETTTTEKPFKFYKKYDYNPDDVLHKKEVTFAFGERIDTTTPAEEYTFSPFYTYVQRYNQHNYSDDMAEKETAIVFSQTHAADWTMSPFYNFHRYYHELNDSVDPRPTDKTSFAFATKDATDSFTLPTFAPFPTVYVYPPHFEDPVTDTPTEETSTQPPVETTLPTVQTTTPTGTSTHPAITTRELLTFAESDIEADLSVLRFTPPNMEEIKQYIDSVTRSRERFCAKNYQYDSDNHLYTLIDRETTPTTRCPRLREQDRAFIEALEKGGLRISTGPPEQTSTKTTEAKNIFDKYNLEEPRLDLTKEQTVEPHHTNVEQTTTLPDSKADLKTYLKGLLHKYSNEVLTAQDSAQRRTNLELKNKILHILEAESKTTEGAQTTQGTKEASDLKASLLNLLHKYSQEVLKTDAITNNRTRRKYVQMKNIMRIALENHSPGPEMDYAKPDWIDEGTSLEKHSDPDNTDETDPDHINLKRQLKQAIDKFSAEHTPKDVYEKQLKSIMRNLLQRNAKSFENVDSFNVIDQPVFNKVTDNGDYILNDVCTDRRFKTRFRTGLKKLLKTYEKEVLYGNASVTGRERRVNKNLLQVLRAAVESHSFGPEVDRLANDGYLDILPRSEEDEIKPTIRNSNMSEKVDLRRQVEKYIKEHKATGHEDTVERDTDSKLKKMLQDFMNENSFEYTNSQEMRGEVKRNQDKPTPSEEPTQTTILTSEEQREIEEERRRRTPTYHYYDEDEEVHKYKDPTHPSTIDYYEFYKEKVTEPRTTTLSESQQKRRDKYIKNVLAMDGILNKQIDAHAEKVRKAGPTTKRPRVTTRDPLETDEVSEEEPFTLFTEYPTDPCIEREFSDSRGYEVPFLDITVTRHTERPEDGYYTPGQGLENRSTIPHSDEYRRARRPFRYDLANPVFKDPKVNTYLVPEGMISQTTTEDYYSFYRHKIRKTTTQTSVTWPTKDQAAYNARFYKNVDAFQRNINEALDARPWPSVTKRRPVRTTMDPDKTEEESEMEPFTFYTREPTDPTIGVDFSDSREYYVPFLGITLSTAPGHPPYYTPGMGLENRSTIPPDDEYARAKMRYKYNPQFELDRLGLTTPPAPERTPYTPRAPAGQRTSVPPTTSPPGGLFGAWRRSKLYSGLDSIKNMVNSSLLHWRGKVKEIVNKVDHRAHRLVHALCDTKHANCSLETN